MSIYRLVKDVLQKLSMRYRSHRARNLNKEKRKEERAPHDCRTKKGERGKKGLLYQNKKIQIVNKKMLCEIDLLL